MKPAFNSTTPQMQKAIPAHVLVVSGNKEDQTYKEVYDAGELELPLQRGRVGGNLTNALLQVLERKEIVTSEKNLSWVDMLKRTKQILEGDGYSQLPQVASSRRFPINTNNKPMNLFPESGGKKRALLIGITYNGQLKPAWPHTNVERVKQYLIKVHAFSPKNIDIQMDDGKAKNPTRTNLLSGMRRLAQASQAGDAAFVLFCGHAGRVSDDETLVPIDFETAGQIRPDELYKNLICAMPANTSLVCWMDLANSGSVIDLPYVFSPKEEGRSELYENAAFELSAVVGLAAVATVAGVGASSGEGGGGGDGAEICCTSCCDGLFSELFGG
mmetsp:Transcript_23398/g.38726  ORF Transcript_23398/g.38726 Transcript_23398/m.38726 type:complete len:329 (+) Transcript_23398:74-1060(+)|eukprot:CAMPEP_0119028730 /NCGR_PEP_ID=MMETSP1176-20130426/39421_1 /TAXON_ID=265551 /ORGANISM="Synedropsis recta cf, Strain CCMP1620" /LENGTH=328 /DNA_ID=CAMNT_0006984933 /DNA_START=280 /DNA_END=1266 /DNA_ORIENTATION=-